MRFVLSIFIIQSLAIAASFAYNNELFVLNKPTHQTIDTTDALKISDLSNVLLAANGFTIDDSVEWKGLKSSNPFSVPKVTLLFTINDENLKFKALADQVRIEINQDDSIDVDMIQNKYENAFGKSDLVKQFDNFPNSSDLEAEFKVFILHFKLTNKD
jgi:hypothetical protein